MASMLEKWLKQEKKEPAHKDLAMKDPAKPSSGVEDYAAESKAEKKKRAVKSIESAFRKQI